MNTQPDFVPEWAKRAVWYQIFPERFCNGNTTNDPTLESLRNSYPHDLSEPWQVHPWTSDWYVQPGRRAEFRRVLERDGFVRSFVSEVVRRHEVLRTVFGEREGRPVQIVHPPVPMQLLPKDLFLPQ